MNELALVSPVELLERLAEKNRVAQQVQFEILELVGALDQQGAAESLGYKDLVEVFKHKLHWDTRTTRSRITLAQALCPTVTPSGSVIGPVLPGVAAAMAEGELSEDHVVMLTEVMAKLPASAEESVVEYAREHEPRSARIFCKELAYLVDQDGPEPKEREPVRPRNVVRWQDRGGRCQLFADVDLETKATLFAMLDPLAKPEPDELRSVGERYGDAFCEVINLALRADRHLDLRQRLPSGERVQLTISVDFDQLRAGIGTARLDDGERIPMAQVRKIACDSGIIPVVLGSRSQVYDVGRKTRAINSSLRRILVVRDKGCAFPGCARPPKHCEAHHVQHWADGGPTNLDNLVLLCRRHHDLVHHSEWQVRITGGLPVFRPPSFLDPQRRPRTNRIRAA